MALQELVEKVVTVITADGRVIVGQLRGFDQVQNMVLSDCHERVYAEDRPVSLQALGLYVLRGDTV